MFEVKYLNYDELIDEEKENTSNNGAGAEYATCIKVVHNDETIIFESDAMEPEDATFYRDLNWIARALQKCYDLGKEDNIASAN